MSYCVEMIRVNSTAIRAVGYDGYTLYVEFLTGQTYEHPRVPYSEFCNLLNADSKGGYYSRHIRGKYR